MKRSIFERMLDDVTIVKRVVHAIRSELLPDERAAVDRVIDVCERIAQGYLAGPRLTGRDQTFTAVQGAVVRATHCYRLLTKTDNQGDSDGNQ